MANKYGVKVGDIFKAVWGYDDTNTNFFQVVKLCGAESVRVREVALPIVTESRTWGSSSKTCRIVNDVCPTTAFSVFIKNQEAGDQKRLRLGYDGKPSFKLRSFADATLVRGDTVDAYDSWMR
jgi:hypothetical protein